MEITLTTTNILFILTVGGTLFAIYSYFREPDISSDKAIALLQQQMNDDRAGTDRRFKDVQDDITAFNKLIQEHVTSDQHKFETMNTTQISMGKDLTRIAAILDERLPPPKRRAR